MDAGVHDGETFNTEFHDILKGTDILVGPGRTEGHSASRDTSTWDQTSPLVSPIVGSRKETRPDGVQSEARPSHLPPIPPPQDPPMPPRAKKKNSASRAWNKLKRSLTKTFGEETKHRPSFRVRLSPSAMMRLGGTNHYFQSLRSPPRKEITCYSRVNARVS